MIVINHVVLVFYLGIGQVLRGKDQEVLFLICLEKLAGSALIAMLQFSET